MLIAVTAVTVTPNGEASRIPMPEHRTRSVRAGRGGLKTLETDGTILYVSG